MKSFLYKNKKLIILSVLVMIPINILLGYIGYLFENETNSILIMITKSILIFVIAVPVVFLIDRFLHSKNR